MKKLIEEKTPVFIERWLKQAYIDGSPVIEDSVLIPQAVENARLIVQFLYRFLNNPEDHTQVRRAIREVAHSDIAKQGDIGEFIHNLNEARILTYRIVQESDFETEEKAAMTEVFHVFFNRLSYYGVTEFAAVKDSIIQNQDQFIQEMHSDRLTILGKIATSFAHEFRNPLTSIQGFIALLEKEFGQDPRAKDYFTLIHHELKGLTDQVSQFLLLSKVKGFEDVSERFSFSDAIREVSDILHHRFMEENIKLHLDVQEDLYYTGVKEQIKQVMLNIMNNATEELSRSKERDNRRINIRAGQKVEGKVHFEIENNGPPIPNHLLKSIFEPFITTKELGTGLGLSVCKQIIEKHNGSIEVISDQRSTCFQIVFSDFTG
jgi:signal transduction histidine kinase